MMDTGTAEPVTVRGSGIMKVSLERVEYNPYRNLKRYPIDKEQVARLRQSIEDLGFWDNLLIRAHPEKRGWYQLAYGHHRLEAAKDYGITTADLAVRDLDDDQMALIMATENATQRNVSAAAAADAVAAAVLRVAVNIADGNLSKIFERLPKRAAEVITGTFSEQGAIGEPVVFAYLNRKNNPDQPKANGHDPSISLGEVRTGLALLRSSGDYLRVLQDARGHVANGNGALIDQAIRSAQGRAPAVRLDGRLANEFENTSQLQTFMGTMRRMQKQTGLEVPVSQQVALARTVKETAKAETQKVTADQIATRTREQFVKQARAIQKETDATVQREKPQVVRRREDAKQALDKALDYWRGAYKAFVEAIEDAEKGWMDPADIVRLKAFPKDVDPLMMRIKKL